MKKSGFVLLLCPMLLLAQRADVTTQMDISRIAFGSCSKQSQTDDQLWSEINSSNPDVWIWLGDNIYGDTEDMSIMKEKYDLQKSHPDYQKLLKRSDVIGIWDDHDYGVNDGGKEFPAKEGSKEALFEFLDIDTDHPARKRKGVYQSYTYQSDNGNVKVILLDTRYFRDVLEWENPGTREKRSIANPQGDILGDAQWAWLETQLLDEEIDLFIVASGIQVIPEKHRWEKWANFPKSRAKLLDLIAKTNAPLILLSGDRHLSEISKMNITGYQHPLYEFTSSSLNSPAGKEKDTNQYLIKKKIHESNFALLSIRWVSNNPVLDIVYQGKGGKVLTEHRIQYQ
ncbi:MAG: alkaline phosphatase D family protein [Ekhidna sp.]